MMKVVMATKQKEIVDALKIRANVFVIEQNVSVEEEIDEYDAFVPLFVAYDSQGMAVGTARLIYKGSYAKIGRVAVEKESRKLGVGRQLMQAITNHVQKEEKVKEIRLDAQLTAVKFYEKIGYKTYGETFKDAGIDHISMRCEL